MPGTIIENLSGRKLSVLVTILLLCQLACFLVGLVSPKPAISQAILATVCVDEEPDKPKLDRWFTRQCAKKVDLQRGTSLNFTNGNNLVFVVQMPNYYDYSRWHQNLVGILEVEFVHMKEQKVLNPIIELTLDVQLAHQDDGETEWKYQAHSEEKRYVDCVLPQGNPGELDGYPYVCSIVPLFELGSTYHDFYLLNLRLPYDGKTKNVEVGHITDIYLHVICMSQGFMKVWVSLKTVFFPILLFILIWFWRRVRILNRSPAVLEYMLFALGLTLLFLDLPIEYLTLIFDMPYMLLLGDIRQGVFYAMLLSFWLVFAGEHMLVQDNGEKNTLKMYWKHLSTIIIGCVSLLIFDLCERGIQLINPFYSIWVTPVGTNLALTFIVLAGLCASMYFIFLCYMIWKVFKNISIKRSILPSMSQARRLHYEGIIYRFNFLMLATVICAAVTIISFILGQVAEGQKKWDENMELELSSVLHTGVYGMWNVYVCAMLMLYAPSHKQWPDDTVCGDSGEEVEFSRLPTEPSANEISSLTSFASKASID